MDIPISNVVRRYGGATKDILSKDKKSNEVGSPLAP